MTRLRAGDRVQLRHRTGTVLERAVPPFGTEEAIYVQWDDEDEPAPYPYVEEILKSMPAPRERGG